MVIFDEGPLQTDIPLLRSTSKKNATYVAGNDNIFHFKSYILLTCEWEKIVRIRNDNYFDIFGILEQNQSRTYFDADLVAIQTV